jgi:hypothetical protein
MATEIAWLAASGIAVCALAGLPHLALLPPLSVGFVATRFLLSLAPAI